MTGSVALATALRKSSVLESQPVVVWYQSTAAGAAVEVGPAVGEVSYQTVHLPLTLPVH